MKALASIAALLALVSTAAAEPAQFTVAPYLKRPPGIVRVLPPPEYDRPYLGKLIVERAETPEDVQRICNMSKPALACAMRRDATQCRIVITPRGLIEAAGYTEDTVMRHELGHCQTPPWPANHPNSRPDNG